MSFYTFSGLDQQYSRHLPPLPTLSNRFGRPGRDKFQNPLCPNFLISLAIKAGDVSRIRRDMFRNISCFFVLVLSVQASNVQNGDPCHRGVPCCVGPKTIATCSLFASSADDTWEVSPCDAINLSPYVFDGSIGSAQCLT